MRAGPLDVRVPSCPDWTLAELAKHVGEFLGFWTHVLCEGAGRPKTEFTACPSPPAIPAWYAGLQSDLVTQLKATPGEATVWTWAADDQSARFVARRSANELAVHRFDAQLARGGQQPIDGRLAADGIDEIFVMIAAWPERSERGNGETLHLQGTDRADKWFIELTPDGPRMERGHDVHQRPGADPTGTGGHLTLRGAVSDLELLLYQRPPLGQVDQIGDGAALAAWYRAFTFG